MDFSYLNKAYRQWSTPGYEKMDLTKLADSYCLALDTNNEDAQVEYFSDLMLRFWFKISKAMKANPTLNLTYDICHDGLKDAILQACDKHNRSWQNKNIKFEQVINQIYDTRFVKQKYVESNQKKNLGRLQEISLDTPIELGDNKKTLGDIVSYEQIEQEQNPLIEALVQDLINKQDYISAIIIDKIAYGDTQVNTFKTVKTTNSVGEAYNYINWSSFISSTKLNRELNAIDLSYLNYLYNNYINLPSQACISACIRAIQQGGPAKKKSYKDNALIKAKKFLQSYQ